MAGPLQSNSGLHGFAGMRTLQDAASGHLVAFSCKDSGQDAGEVSPPLRAMNHDQSHANAGGQVVIAFDTQQITSKANRTRAEGTLPASTLAARSRMHVAFAVNAKGGSGRLDGESETLLPVDARQVQWASGGGQVENETAQGLRANAEHSYQFARIGRAVRRLTPRECEWLQGFPDDWTLIPWHGRPREQCPDGPRYRALGNAFAVPVIRWIGERIQRLEALRGCRGV